jgi:hypothetical protein
MADTPGDELLWQLQEDMRAGDLEAIRDRQAEIDSLSEGWGSKHSIGERSTVGSSNMR